MIEVIFYTIGAIIILAGLVGAVLPLLPGVPLVFLGIFTISAVAKFSFISTTSLIVLGFLALLSVGVDYLSGFLGAKFSGSSLAGLFGAILGMVFGVSVFGLIGFLIGPTIGVFIFDYVSRRSAKKSAKAATYTFLSTVSGIVINSLLALLMVGIFIGSLLI